MLHIFRMEHSARLKSIIWLFLYDTVSECFLIHLWINFLSGNAAVIGRNDVAIADSHTRARSFDVPSTIFNDIQQTLICAVAYANKLRALLAADRYETTNALAQCITYQLMLLDSL